VSWLDWKWDRPRRQLLEFTKMLIGIFHQHPVLRRSHFFQGRKIRGSEVKDLAWFRPDGKEMTDEDWANSEIRCFGLRLAGDAIEEVDGRGNRVVDDTLLILLNAHHETMPFVLPVHRRKLHWWVILDTSEPTTRRERQLRGAVPYLLNGRSLVLLRLSRHDEQDTENGFKAAPARRQRQNAASGQ
jgi:glycogen operon protein